MHTLVLCLLLLSSALAATLDATSNSITPTYAGSPSTAYSFTFSAVAPFVQNFDMVISFPPQFALTAPTGC